MHHPFLPLVLLVVAPVFVLSGRTGALGRPAFRWLLYGLAAASAAAGVAAGGVDFTYVNRLKLLIAAATMAIVGLKAAGLFGLGEVRAYRTTLAILTGLASIVHLNFLGFHATGTQRTYIHLHDVAHYYLGAKYALELDYGDLYAAMLRADAENGSAPAAGLQARDLRSNRLVDVGIVLDDSAPLRARFSASRWEDFRADVGFFRRALGPQFDDLFRDHGYNPTPVWTLIGGTLAGLVPAGSHLGILSLTLIDPVLLGFAFLMIGWTFGLETALLAVIHFCVLFGASFGWLGGAFLRYLWFFAIVIAVCAMQRRKPAAAGGFLALAAVLRLFPALLLVGHLMRALTDKEEQRQRRLVLFVSFAAVGVLLAGSTALLPGGVARWGSFRTNMERHVEHTAFNTIGSSQVFLGTLRLFYPPVDEESDVAQRRFINRTQLLLALPLALFWLAWRCRGRSDADTTAMGILLLFFGLNLACYYYVCLVLLILAHARRASSLLLIFGIEVATYTLALFDDREAILFFYRNVLVMFLLVGLYLPEGEATADR